MIYKEETSKHCLNHNIVKDWLETGLDKWIKLAPQIKIEYLNKNELSIPVIETGGSGNLKVLVAAGIHLEEISGPKVALNPDNFSQWISQDVDFVIIPVVNQWGLRYPENSHDHLLRYDQEGRNYNDGWGQCLPTYKPLETYLIEDKIEKSHSKKPFDLAISMHEDSEHPNIGYFCTCDVPSDRREKIVQLLKACPKTKPFLAEFNEHTNPLGGILEDGFMIVDDPDPRAFENWLSDHFKIPTILVEGPFSPPLETRENFQINSINAMLHTFFER